LSQAATGMILHYQRQHFRVNIAALGSLKQVTRKIFKICKQFQEASYNSEFGFLST
jgi:hypothetical protein